jgi:hypothetical protein
VQRSKRALLPVGIGLSLLVLSAAVRAEDEVGNHGWVLELGPAAEWPLGSDPANYGASLAVEKELIEGWLEVEFGMAAHWTSGRTELSWDLLFKKPFTLSPTVELMVGLGPEFVQTLNGADMGTKVNAEFALELMVWPTKRVGWFIEPTFSVNPGNGQAAFALTGGIIISFP